MSMNNLSQTSVDGEFRYVIQWFNEFSELQREDFVPVLVEYLTKPETAAGAAAGEVYINGLNSSMANAMDISDRPMSLFQCRIKLFHEWSPKWPVEFKYKLKEKIVEIDSKVGEKIINEIKGINGNNNGLSNGTGSAAENAAAAAAIAADDVAVDDTKVATAVVHTEQEITAAAVAIVEATEDAINADQRLAAMLSNETPVDDVDEEIVASAAQAEPVGPVPMPTQAQAEKEVVAATVATEPAAVNKVEVPLVA